MEIVRTKKALQEAIRRARDLGKQVAFAPTMGALHAGHISLMEAAKQQAERVVASIFVNPLQFGPKEDFSRYPRDEKGDLAKLEGAGVNIVYLPTVDEMYPAGATTHVEVGAIANELCGAFRPGHFSGVATVVLKLFMQVQPDVALFGEKDFQQLHIIRQMVRDLNVPIKIVGVPIMRESDGLAMSSRNQYLNPEQRKVAALLYAILKKGKVEGAQEALLKAGFDKVDYVELRDGETLLPIKENVIPAKAGILAKTPAFAGVTPPRGARLLAAAHLGTTRLIDNLEILP